MGKRWILLLIVLCGFVFYGANISGTSIYVLDEAKNAGCAMEMTQRGDWIVPTFNNELRTDKPPLHYYFMRMAYGLFGVNSFSARIFSVVMGVVLLVVIYLFVSSLSSSAAGVWSVLTMVVSIQLSVQFHLAVPDPYLIFFLSSGLFSFYYGYKSNQQIFLFLSYASIGLATLAKGPVAIVFAGLTGLLFILTQERFSLNMLKRIKILHGIIIFLLVVLPWYVLVGVKTNGAWLEGFFIQHNVGRFTNTMEGHGGFPLSSLVIVLVALLPFSFFTPQAIHWAWKNRKSESHLYFCLIAMMVVVVFFAFSRTILPSYPEPAVPFLAVLLGCYFAHVLKDNLLPRYWKISAWVYVIIAASMPFAAWIALDNDVALHHLSTLAGYFLLFPVGAVTGIIMLYNDQFRNALIVYAASTGVFLILFFYVVFPKIDQLNPVTNGLKEMEMNTPVYYYKNFNPAFVFGMKQSIQKISAEERSLAMPVYVITQKRFLPDFQTRDYELIHEGQDLFESNRSIVIKLMP